MTLPFVSTDDLEAVLRASVASQTDLATIALDSGCEAVRTHLAQHINLVMEETVKLNGSGTRALLLPELPVIEVIELLEEDEVLLPDDDYYVDMEDGVVYRQYPLGWPMGKGNITVTYSHGWAPTEDAVVETPGSGQVGPIYRVPSDIRRVALQAAKRLYIGAGATPPTQSETIGGYSYSTAAGAGVDPEFTPGELKVLDPYRRRRYR